MTYTNLLTKIKINMTQLKVKIKCTGNCKTFVGVTGSMCKICGWNELAENNGLQIFERNRTTAINDFLDNILKQQKNK